VTNLNDAGAGSLRAAIASTPAGGTVDFQLGLSGRITLTTGELAISKNLSIAGPGASVITVSGNHASRVFDIAAASTVAISGLTIADGMISGNGGGIYSSGTLTVSNCILSGNSTNNGGGDLSAFGGGIYNSSGTLTVSNCTLSSNSVSVSGDFTEAFGGGIYNAGSLIVTASTLNGNSSSNSGSSNSAFGGGILNTGTLTITNSILTGNSTKGQRGGGIENLGGTVVIASSTLEANSADFINGGGGGIESDQGTLTVTNSTFSGNSAFIGGGIDSEGITGIATLTVTNSTFSGNSAVFGGAIFDFNTQTVITSCTISGNSAQSLGGGITVDQFGTPPPAMRNTIIARDFAPSSPDVDGILSSQGHNLIGDGTGGSGYVSTDLVGTSAHPIDPKLGPLQNNGGPTQTMALLPGSPAIDAGDNAFSPGPFDQRGLGYPRIVNGIIDIGAFEVQGAVAPTVTCSVADSLLWPPDQQLVNVGLSVVVQPPDATLQVQVYANDGADPSDAADIAPGTLRLRADRQGDGDGRVYLIVTTAANPAGTGFDVCTVVVPHDESPEALAAVQAEAAAAEAFYRQFQTAPPGFSLLGESPAGAGGGGLPSQDPPGAGPSSGDVFLLPPSSLASLLASPTRPLTTGTAAATAPADRAPPGWKTLPVDGFLAAAHEAASRSTWAGSRHEGPGEADQQLFDPGLKEDHH
jgi:hypothetical protein